MSTVIPALLISSFLFTLIKRVTSSFFSLVKVGGFTNVINLFKVSVRGGIYSVYVEDWLKVFPREQMYFVHHETYANDRGADVDGILHFAGLGMYMYANLE